MAKLLGLLLLVVAVVGSAVGAAAEENCDEDRKGLIAECQKYATFPAEPKIPPSDACCAVWKKANVPCLCSRVTKEVEKRWCMEKVVYFAKYCGKPMQPGYQCGSYTVPNDGQL